MSRSLIIGIVITLLLISGLASVFYYLYIKEKEKPLFDAIPNDAAMVIETQNISGKWITLKQSDLWKGLIKNEAIVALTAKLNKIDSLVNLNSNFQDLLGGKKAAVSFHRTNHINVLIVMQADELENWSDEVINLCSKQGYIVSKRTFEKELVLDITDSEHNAICSISQKDKLLLCSSDGSLVEQSIIKLKYKIPNPVRRLENITSLTKAGADLNLFINYSNLSNLLSEFLRTEYAGLFDYLKRFANWSAFEVNLDKENLSFKGVTVTDDSLYQYLDLFSNQIPITSTLEQYLPSNTAFKLQLGFSDYPKFKNELTEYLQQIGKFDEYVSYKDSIEKLYGVELDIEFENNIGNQALIGCIESSSIDIDKNSFALLHARDINYSKTLLNGYLQKCNKRFISDSLNTPNLATRLPFGNFLKLYFGGLFESIESPYFAFVDDVIVFANTPETLAKIVGDVASKNTLMGNASYSDFRKNSGETYNFNIFLNTSMALQLPANYTNEEFYSQLNRFGDDYKKFEFIQIQYAASSDKSFYTQLNYKYNIAFEEDTRMLWQTKLDTAISGKPTIVYNSVTNQNCVLVQDINNTLYFVSNSGSILWRTKLSGKIISPITQVDKDKNGQKAYLFNTSTQTCLINETGLNVYGYPVRFPGRTEYPLFYTDLFGDSNYTWYVVLTNNRIAGYSLDGRIVKGWNPKIISAGPAAPLNQLALGTSRYLYTTDVNGVPLVYNYSGEWKKTELLNTRKGSAIYINNVDTTHAFVYSIDSSGSLVKYSLGSDLKIKDLHTLTLWNNNSLNPSLYKPTGELFFLMSDSFNFSIWNDKGEKIFSKNIPDTLTILPLTGATSDGKLMISYFSNKEKKVYWYDTHGNLYPTFPLDGNSLFEVGPLTSQSANNLITSDIMNNLRVYRLK